MSMVWPDLAVRALLSSSLVMAQAILRNWLKIPFAAVTFFSGLAAYALVIGVWPIAGILVVAGLVFALTVKPLPNDRYLLLSLAALELTRSAVGSSQRLGGQLGVQLVSHRIAAQQPFSALPFAAALFAVSLIMLLLLRYSELGLAVDLVRLGRSDPIANTMTAEALLTKLFFAFVILVTALTGAVQGAYVGWIDPNVFRIDDAITLLVASMVIGRRPFTGTLLALAFFLFPDLFSMLSGYSQLSAAHLREMLWGIGVIVLAAPGRVDEAGGVCA